MDSEEIEYPDGQKAIVDGLGINHSFDQETSATSLLGSEKTLGHE